MNAVAMNNLWTYLQGLSLTAKNKKWLSERLIEPVLILPAAVPTARCAMVASSVSPER